MGDPSGSWDRNPLFWYLPSGDSKYAAGKFVLRCRRAALTWSALPPFSRPIRVFVTIFSTGLLLACGLDVKQSFARPGANLIIISIDTLRADRLESYGYERPTSPTIDALAAKGARFTKALAQAPWTLPSHMTLMSGLFPSAHGATRFGRKLPKEIPTLAEVLQRDGYRTFAYTTGGFVGSVYGFGRGFESYFEKIAHFGGLISRATQKIRGLAPEERYFLFLQTFDVHCPYQPLQEYALQFQTRPPADHIDTTGKCGDLDSLNTSLSDGQIHFISDMYDAGIRQTDDALGELVEFLQEQNAFDNTIFILLSDHGEEFGEHEELGHGRALYNEVLRVPLVILAPGFPPRVIDERVGLVDVMPTVLDLLKIESPPIQGRSLLPLLAGLEKKGSVEWVQFSETNPNKASLRSIVLDDSKLIVDLNSGDVELFDLLHDPEERVNLAAEQPERVSELRQRLDSHFESITRAEAAPSAQPTQENLEQLRTLGYIE